MLRSIVVVIYLLESSYTYLFFRCTLMFFYFFFFINDTATTEIYTLSLHDALPILICGQQHRRPVPAVRGFQQPPNLADGRSEEHTSELQSHSDLVCRLLLEKKKKKKINRS